MTQINDSTRSDSAFNQDSLFCYGDALRSPVEPLVCTMRIYESVKPTKSADLFESDSVDAVQEETTKKAFHKFYSVRDLQNLEHVLAGAKDAYISQATFDEPKRREVNVSSIQTLFVDLDIYNVNISAEQTAEKLTSMFDAIGISDPSISTVSSGRGMYVKLPLAESVSKRDMPQWKRVQQGLINYLAPLGSDPKVKDSARVLRAVGSVNSKNGGYVEVLRQASNPVTLSEIESRLQDAGMFNMAAARTARNVRGHSRKPYDANAEALSGDERTWASGFAPFKLDKFTELFSNQDSQAYPNTKKGMLRRKYQEFCWQSLADIDCVARLRGGKFVSGARDSSVFWSLVLLGQAGFVSPENFWTEACALAARTAGAYNPMADGSLNALLSRLCDSTAFGTNNLYVATKDRLMDEIGITSDEEKELSVLISNAEYKRRTYQSVRVAREAEGIRSNERRFLVKLDRFMKQEILAARNEMRVPRLTNEFLSLKMKVDSRTIRRYRSMLDA